MDRTTEHGKGVPGESFSRRSRLSRLSRRGSTRTDASRFAAVGIFFKYDIEPMALMIRERTTSLVQFLVRLAGIVGGILGEPNAIRVR
jgi:hypothetical protein